MKLIQVYINLAFFVLATSVMKGCIEPFMPELEDAGRYMVINGLVTNQQGYQYAEVSWSSSFAHRKFKPIDNCTLKIADGNGNEFLMESYEKGKYRVWMEKQDLQIGRKYKLQVKTKHGNVYESAYDEILPCPDIDTMYYELQEKKFDNPQRSPIKGIQIFIDADATGNHAGHYRWELVETWEYKAFYLIYSYYNGHEIVNLSIDNPTDSLSTCWKTLKIKDVYTYSADQKNTKKIIGLPLNYVSNQTDRLTVKYSLLIKQYSLSDSSFVYWDQLRNSTDENAGLYQRQPERITGNIRSKENREEVVLGFFSASAVSEKRFFIEGQDIFPFTPGCELIISDQDELRAYLSEVETGELPVYLINISFEPQGPYYLTDQDCFDCRSKEGTIYKPDFWE